MKLQTTFLAATAVFMMLAASCTPPCHECTKDGDQLRSVCRDKHPNQSSFEAELEYLQENGYTCTEQ